MSITKDVPVPTSYRRLQEKRLFNTPFRVLMVWGIFVIIIGFIFINLWNYGCTEPVVYLVPVVVFGGVVYLFARDGKTLDTSILHIILIWRMLRNKHVIKKYVEPLDDLKKVVPIESVEDTGLIRYTNGSSGILTLLDPPRTANEEIDRHNLKMKNVINSLYGKFSFQFLAISKQNMRNPLTMATMEAMKNKDISMQTADHLHSIYTESVEQDQEVIDWTFLLHISLPVTKTVDEAEKLKAAFMSGLSKELGRANVFSRIVEDRNEVIQLLRGCIC